MWIVPGNPPCLLILPSRSAIHTYTLGLTIKDIKALIDMNTKALHLTNGIAATGGMLVLSGARVSLLSRIIDILSDSV
jgi:hypothetical protein